jgi:hypothetical protein
MEKRRHSGPVKLVGAGIVPLSICPSTGVPHLLLGKERFVHGWSCSNKVSGFEGGNKCSETPEQNAARECHEETLGLVYASKDRCVADLIEGHFIMCIVNESRTKSHVTYITLVPWIRDEGFKFNEIRSFLMELDTEAKKLDTIRSYTRAVLLGISEDGWTLNGISRNTLKVRTKLERMLASSPHGVHPAIFVSRDKDGIIQRVHVNSDYLEKVDMQYISVHTANEMLNSHPSILRPFFRPVLAAICTNILERPITTRRDSLKPYISHPQSQPHSHCT